MGPETCPVWGERFYAESNGEEAEIKERIAKQVAFLQSIQTATRTASLKLEGQLSRGPNSESWRAEGSIFGNRSKTIMVSKEPRTKNCQSTQSETLLLYTALSGESSRPRSCLAAAMIAWPPSRCDPGSLNLRRNDPKIRPTLEPVLAHHVNAQDTELFRCRKRPELLSRDSGRLTYRSYDRIHRWSCLSRLQD
jgi:hypothetical protein